VLVGDLQPAKAIELAQNAFGSWKGKPTGPQPGAPVLNTAGLPTVIVDRPGSVQTNVRIAGPALPRKDPGFLPLSVANLVYGGYFSSRLVKNIREDKGYTYSPSSSFDHRRFSSTFVSSAEVGSDVTAPSLVEIRYELGRMASLPPKPEELAAAKRYLSGVTMLSLQTQAGLAANLIGLVAGELPLDYFTGFAAAVEQVTAEQVHEAGVRFLAPKKLMTLLVGDASAIRAGVEALDDVEVVPSP
jgi:predicted Zn-dependent peptidase